MRFLIAIALLAAAGCTEEDDGCTQQLVTAVSVRPVDASTGERVLARVRFYEDGVLYLSCMTQVDQLCRITEGPGIFDITVDAEGYQPVSIERVVVVLNDSGCHPIPVRLLVELEPL